MSVEIAETQAILYGTSLAREAVFNKIMVESDNKTCVEGLLAQSKGLTYVGQVLDDVLAWADIFQAWKIQFVPREANKLSHNLAQLARQTLLILF